MTLIALTLNHGSPILMGDILISSPLASDDLETPTFVKGTKKLLKDLSGSKPMGLSQKLYVVNERLCLALGGRLDQMLTFLNRVTALFGNVDFNALELRDYISHYPMEDKDQLDAIVLSSTKVGDEVEFGVELVGDVKIRNSEVYQKVVAAGSGADQFLKFMEQLPAFGTDLEDPRTVTNLVLMGYWLGNEMYYGDSLINRWGAGYEMISFVDDKFLKLQEYTVVVLEGSFGRDLEFNPAPINTIMFNYQDDQLVIYAYTVDKHGIFVAPRIDNTAMVVEVVETPTQRNDTLLITYLIKDVDSRIIHFPTVAFARNVNELRKTPIQIEFVDGELRLYTDSNYDKYIHSIVRKNYESLNENH